MTNTNQELNIVELTPKDFDRAADLLAEAFYDNPLHVYIFPNPANRLKAIRWMLRGNLNNNLNSRKNIIGQSFALVESNSPEVRKIKAMAFWNPPHGDSVSLFSMVKEGLLTMPIRFGWGSFSRLFEVIEKIGIVKKQALDDTPAWYLNNMVVAPDLRRTGIGSKLLTQQLESVVNPSGFPAILVTQREANVRFYKRLGFNVVAKSTVGSGESAFTNWCMTRHSN
ncbi:MAG: GNAT family N-acetyltransferase [Pleurocapsa sp. MO_192.B19]|nr:GNAT family N-acetyltransferase [Pleurocapsa sp. MO_192.B19]